MTADLLHPEEKPATECHCTPSSVCAYCANDLHLSASPDFSTLLDELEKANRVVGLDRKTLARRRSSREAVEAKYAEQKAAHDFDSKYWKEEFLRLRSRIAELEAERAHEERVASDLLDERDAAEEAMSQAYFLIIGESPEWSNQWGYASALQEIDDAQSLLRSRIAEHALCRGEGSTHIVEGLTREEAAVVLAALETAKYDGLAASSIGAKLRLLSEEEGK